MAVNTKSIGIDGCKSGWVAACYNSHEVIVFNRFKDITDYFGSDALYLADIPVGLPDKDHERTCDHEARKVLTGKRKSSVFGVPCREALTAKNYTEANAINRQVLGKGLSVQTWNITAKIKEVDDYLFFNRDVNILESHPEIAFLYLNNNIQLSYNKKTKEGIDERLKILTSLNPDSETMFNTALKTYSRNQAKKDDILDALCLATALHLSHGKLNQLPEKPLPDKRGITMAIHYTSLNA